MVHENIVQKIQIWIAKCLDIYCAYLLLSDNVSKTGYKKWDLASFVFTKKLYSKHWGI